MYVERQESQEETLRLRMESLTKHERVVGEVLWAFNYIEQLQRVPNAAWYHSSQDRAFLSEALHEYIKARVDLDGAVKISWRPSSAAEVDLKRIRSVVEGLGPQYTEAEGLTALNKVYRILGEAARRARSATRE
jgi:hypothetical protein